MSIMLVNGIVLLVSRLLNKMKGKESKKKMDNDELFNCTYY